MAIDDVVQAIDREIARLTQARNLLAGDQPQRTMSAEGRKKMSDLMKKKWQERKKILSKAR